MLASGSVFASVCWMPAGRREVYLPVRFEVRHVLLHVIQRCRPCQAPSVRPPIRGTEHDVLGFGNRDDSAKQRVEFRFVCDQRFTPQTEATGLAQKHQTETFHVNDQRQLPKVRSRCAPRTPREPRVGVRVQDEHVSRWLSADSIRPVSRVSHSSSLANGCGSPAAALRQLRRPSGATACYAALRTVVLLHLSPGFFM